MGKCLSHSPAVRDIRDKGDRPLWRAANACVWTGWGFMEDFVVVLASGGPPRRLLGLEGWSYGGKAFPKGLMGTESQRHSCLGL